MQERTQQVAVAPAGERVPAAAVALLPVTLLLVVIYPS